MTDKELLSLAAKAARLEPNGVYGWKYEGDDCIWNPLTDDGDALRLAVKLKMNVEIDFDRVDVWLTSNETTEYLYDNPEPTDPYAATRRAIVRAAAEIGRSMG